MDRFCSPLDIVTVRPGQTGHGGAFDPLGDELDCFEVTGRCRRKTRLDDVDTQIDQGIGHLELLLDRHGCARRLLAIAQRRVEDPDSLTYTRLRG